MPLQQALSMRGAVAVRPAAAIATAPRRAARRSWTAARATSLPAEVRSVRPSGGRVLVKVEEAESKSSGGILLPSSAQKKPTSGKVVDAGSAETVKSGDRVLYSKYAGTEVELGDESFVILKEEDVIGVAVSDDVETLAPLADRVLVRVAEASETTTGGLILTEASREQPTVGTVVAVGPGKPAAKGKDKDAAASVDEAVAPEVEEKLPVGAKVLYQRYTGTELENADGTKYVVVRGKDVLATLG